MTKTYWGANKGERYPAGSPLGGKFKPATYTLPPLKSEIVSADKLAKTKINSYTDYAINDYVQTCIKGLDESLDGIKDARKNALASGMTDQDIQAIHAAVSQHAGKLIRTQAIIRPKVFKKIAEYDVAWEDFEEFPATAIVDHKMKQILLNPKFFLDKKMPETNDGSIMETVTHEMSHIIDLNAGKEDFALTGAFKPLHEFLEQYQKKMGTERWMLSSGLGYPLNGYSGIVQKSQKDYFLSGEYVSTVSEMFWHKPKMLDALDRHFATIGYPGPSMRELAQRVWGVDNTKSGPEDSDVVDTSKYNPSQIGGSKRAGTAAWSGEASLESTLGALSF